ncbi:hypothetical protein QJS66_07065 [Kocuria rhizophila]|nr:hypothetical protein QJS66_07065 [Kocuria rhizophila]
MPAVVPQPDVLARAEAAERALRAGDGRAPVGVGCAGPARTSWGSTSTDGVGCASADQYVTLTAAAPRTDGARRALSLQDADESVADHRLRTTPVVDIAPARHRRLVRRRRRGRVGHAAVASGRSDHPVAVPELARPLDFGADDGGLHRAHRRRTGLLRGRSARSRSALFSLSTGHDAPHGPPAAAPGPRMHGRQNHIVGANTGGLDQTASRARMWGDPRPGLPDFDVATAGRSLRRRSHAARRWTAPRTAGDGQYSSRREQCEAAAAVLGVPRAAERLPTPPTPMTRRPRSSSASTPCCAP